MAWMMVSSPTAPLTCSPAGATTAGRGGAGGGGGEGLEKPISFEISLEKSNGEKDEAKLHAGAPLCQHLGERAHGGGSSRKVSEEGKQARPSAAGSRGEWRASRQGHQQQAREARTRADSRRWEGLFLGCLAAVRDRSAVAAAVLRGAGQRRSKQGLLVTVSRGHGGKGVVKLQRARERLDVLVGIRQKGLQLQDVEHACRQDDETG